MAEALPDAGEDPAAAMMPPRRGAKEMTFSLKCLKDKMVPIGVTVLVAALLISVIALAARKCPSCPSPILPSCSENGIGFGEKCFYFVEEEADWNRSQSFCLSRRAQLATIDSQEDLGFIMRYKGQGNHWFGLHEEGNGQWRWTNGTAFNTWFEMRGGGPCAYLNQEKISSALCHTEKYWICSRPNNYVLWRQKIYPE
nr:C-type lectin domain family 2 member A-like isoform X4 [Anser cygnoides]